MSAVSLKDADSSTVVFAAAVAAAAVGSARTSVHRVRDLHSNSPEFPVLQ